MHMHETKLQEGHDLHGGLKFPIEIGQYLTHFTLNPSEVIILQEGSDYITAHIDIWIKIWLNICKFIFIHAHIWSSLYLIGLIMFELIVASYF